MEEKKVISVYAEMTPNPVTMKFVANKLLTNLKGSMEFSDPEECSNSPLAAQIFNFPFVTSVFISENFITVSRNDLVDWNDVVLDLREFIQDFLRKDFPVVFESSESSSDQNSKEVYNIPINHVAPNNDIEKRVIEVLEEYVQPAVAGDGGAILFKSLDEGVLTVSMKGSCQGCPSSTVTLKNGIEGLFSKMMPDEVKEVVAEDLV